MTVLVPGVVDGDDARVVERREDRRFTPEACDPVLVVRHVGVDDFDRDVTLQTRIAGPVHRPHPAASDFLQQQVVREGGARLQLQRCDRR